jgi:hypothetical protein
MPSICGHEKNFWPVSLVISVSQTMLTLCVRDGLYDCREKNPSCTCRCGESMPKFKKWEHTTHVLYRRAGSKMPWSQQKNLLQSHAKNFILKSYLQVKTFSSGLLLSARPQLRPQGFLQPRLQPSRACRFDHTATLRRATLRPLHQSAFIRCFSGFFILISDTIKSWSW